MDSQVRQNSSSSASWDPKYPFDLVVAYEDITTRNQALRLYDRLAQRLLDDYDFQCTWWRFDHLLNRSILERAVDAACEANMVVVSVRERDALPDMAAEWLEMLAGRKDDRKSALVALVCGVTPGTQMTSPVVGALHKAALELRMDFFCNTFDLPQGAGDLSFAQIAARVNTVTPLLEEILHRPVPFPRWGINE